MKNTIMIVLLIIASFTGLQSCYYDKADMLYPNTVACDTTAVVSYSQKIVPLFQQQCYSCHLTASMGGGILMGSYAADKAIAVNGKLYGSVSYASGFSPMPKGANKMTSCQLALVKKWIDAGAPNN
jgi:hypothetical protein